MGAVFGLRREIGRIHREQLGSLPGKVQNAGVDLLAGVELLARTPGAGSYGSRHNLEMAAGWFRVCDVIAAVSLENASIRGSPHHHMSEG